MTWPVSLAEGTVGLRPLRQRDGRRWREVRLRNRDWLQPWEATLPSEVARSGEVPASYGHMVRRLRREAQLGRALPWAVTENGVLVGQLTVGGIALGSLRSAFIGYWIDKDVAGRGIMPTAVALAADYCLDGLQLHRIEINIRPENTASRRVVEKLGLREEGLREQYLHINGDWRDHLTYVLLAGEFPGGVMARLRDRLALLDE